MKRTLLIMMIFLASSAFAQLKPVLYTDGAQKLNGFFIKAAEGSPAKGGILILPAWMGVDEHSKETAVELSKLGYHAFVADIYGEGNYPADAKQAGERSSFYKKEYSNYHKRINLALAQLLKAGADPNKIVVMGYCFGGTGALEAARAGLGVQGVVSIHGGLGKDPSRASNPISAKVLVLHGADDPGVPEAQVKAFQQEMRDSKADWQMIYYANAVHGFTHKDAGSDNSKGYAYNELADKRSWIHLQDFLNEVL